MLTGDDKMLHKKEEKEVSVTVIKSKSETIFKQLVFSCSFG